MILNLNATLRTIIFEKYIQLLTKPDKWKYKEYYKGVGTSYGARCPSKQHSI